ncbi:MAG: universal stress protein [Burkholderiales bacterium]|nr:universal stress protein [Burkholderiales bacterium]
MHQFDRILAATDLSAPARHAAERAALVSKEAGASLDLLHVANFDTLERLRLLMEVAPDDMQTRVLDTARARVAELALVLQQRYGISAGARVAAGSLLPELAKECEARTADLLVCGAQGESVLRHFLLGTTAKRILSTAKCPVLVVKQTPHEPYQRLLVPVDFSPSSLRAIRHARNIAPLADIILLHAFDVPFEGKMRYANVDDEIINHYRVVAKLEALQKLTALRDEAGLSSNGSCLIVLHGDARSRIIEQEQERDCDLIVMGKHGKNLIEELLLGSVTEHVLNEAQSDVLVSI